MILILTMKNAMHLVNLKIELYIYICIYNYILRDIPHIKMYDFYQLYNNNNYYFYTIILFLSILLVYGYPIIYKFTKYYYFYSRRINYKPMNIKTLRNAIKLYCINEREAYIQYGFPAYWNVSGITDMSKLFIGYSEFVSKVDISGWDVSSLKNARMMFFGCKKFYNNDLNKWNVGEMEDASFMFCNSGFDGNIDWKTNNLIDASSMFERCHFNGKINLYLGKVKDMSGMFANNKKFNHDISDWDVGTVEDMSGMFEGCSSFNCNLESWAVNKFTCTYCMFENCNTKKPSWYK